MSVLNIAYPGAPGSFSHAAAREAFAACPQAVFCPYATFEETAEAVVSGAADYALLPVENSHAGAVLTTYELLENLPLYIVRETAKAVRQQLLTVPGAKLSDIRTISSHPQALAQCRDFLRTLPGVTVVPSENTAISARETAERGDPAFAAIGSAEAAETWGLQILCRDIQSSRTNMTRFFVLSRKPEPLGSPDKATLVFRVTNEVGALAEVLTVFARGGLNMCRIESRPIPGERFAYFFSCDFEDVTDRGAAEEAIVQAAPRLRSCRLLGVYPGVTGMVRGKAEE